MGCVRAPAASYGALGDGPHGAMGRAGDEWKGSVGGGLEGYIDSIYIYICTMDLYVLFERLPFRLSTKLYIALKKPD